VSTSSLIPGSYSPDHTDRVPQIFHQETGLADDHGGGMTPSGVFATHAFQLRQALIIYQFHRPIRPSRVS